MPDTPVLSEPSIRKIMSFLPRFSDSAKDKTSVQGSQKSRFTSYYEVYEEL